MYLLPLSAEKRGLIAPHQWTRDPESQGPQRLSGPKCFNVTSCHAIFRPTPNHEFGGKRLLACRERIVALAYLLVQKFTPSISSEFEASWFESTNNLQIVVVFLSIVSFITHIIFVFTFTIARTLNSFAILSAENFGNSCFVNKLNIRHHLGFLNLLAT